MTGTIRNAKRKLEYQELLDQGLTPQQIADKLRVKVYQAKKFIADNKLVPVRPKQAHDTRKFTCMDYGDHSSSRHGQKIISQPREPWVQP